MPTTVTATTLCVCRHIHSMHNQDADCMLCRCSRFHRSASTSSSHYRRGQATARKRVARLEEGDRVLVAFAEDGQLEPAESKTGALVATVTDVRRVALAGLWQITTNLGPLSVLSGPRAVHVVTEPLPW